MQLSWNFSHLNLSEYTLDDVIVIVGLYLLRKQCCMVKMVRTFVVSVILSCCPFTETIQSTGGMCANNQTSLDSRSEGGKNKY